MSQINLLSYNNVASVNLLRAIQQGDIASVKEQLAFSSVQQIDAPVGPLQITAIELASSLPLHQSLPLIEILISSGANVSSRDKLGRTPLHLACCNGYIEIVKLLIDHGANINSKYELCSRNLEQTDDLGFSSLLPLPDCFGRTPLHEAVKGNHNEIVKLLLEHGAFVDVEDESGFTPILLAGASVESDTLHNYEDIIYLLISYDANINVFNDYTGTTPLHHAVCVNSYLATDMLLKANAIIKDGACGQTPIHEAAGRGFSNILSLLLSHEDIGVNRPDNDGRTALHKAAFAGSRECIKILVNHGGDLSAETTSAVSVFDIIFSYVPRPIHLLNEMFNSKIRSKNISVNDVNFTVEMDFRVLSPKGADRQMSVIEALLSAGNDNQILELLQNPLIETFLLLKWRKMRLFFVLLVLIHSIFVLALSFYAMLIVHRSSWPEILEDIARHILELSAFSLFAHSVIQCYLVPRHYIKQYEMWLNMICALLSFIVAVVKSDSNKIISNGQTIRVPEDWQLHITSIVVLLAWIELMLLIGRFPRYGYYALMFSAVLQNVIKVLLTFVCLVIGFAISFSIQFHADEQFSDPWRSLVKTTVMMMGEFDYGDLFTDKDDDIRLPATSRIIFVLFIILSSIVLMNLMVGLAVNDIQGLQKEGHAKRLAKQAIFLSHLEKVLSHKLLKSNWFLTDFFKMLYSRRKIDVMLVLKPGKRGVKKDMGIDLDGHNEAKHIPLSIIETVINVAISNANLIPMRDDLTDKDILLNIMETLNALKIDLQNIKSNILKTKM